MKSTITKALLALVASIVSMPIFAKSVTTVVNVNNVIPAVDIGWSMTGQVSQYANMTYLASKKTLSPAIYTYSIENTFKSAIPSFNLIATLQDSKFACSDESKTVLALGTDYLVKFDGTSLLANQSATVSGNTVDADFKRVVSGRIEVSVQKALDKLSTKADATCSGHAVFLIGVEV